MRLYQRLHCVRVRQFSVVLVSGWLVHERRYVRSLRSRVVLCLGILADMLAVPRGHFCRVAGCDVVLALPSGQLVVERVGLLPRVRGVILLLPHGVRVRQVPERVELDRGKRAIPSVHMHVRVRLHCKRNGRRQPCVLVPRGDVRQQQRLRLVRRRLVFSGAELARLHLVLGGILQRVGWRNFVRSMPRRELVVRPRIFELFCLR